MNSNAWELTENCKPFPQLQLVLASGIPWVAFVDGPILVKSTITQYTSCVRQLIIVYRYIVVVSGYVLTTALSKNYSWYLSIARE